MGGGGGGGGRRHQGDGTVADRSGESPRTGASGGPEAAKPVSEQSSSGGTDGSPGTADPAAPSPLKALGRLLRGDIGFFVESIERSLARARDRIAKEAGEGLDDRLIHDASVISGIALAMMSLKMIKVLPGIQFFSGWKTMFFYPLYILAAQLTHTRWGGTTAGTIMGVLGYMQGDGRYGFLEIFKHIVPGLVVDLLWPLVRRLPHSAIAL